MFADTVRVTNVCIIINICWPLVPIGRTNAKAVARLSSNTCIQQVLNSSRDGQPFGHTRHEPKNGGCAPLGGAWFPCNTMWPGPRPISVPSGILIHPAVWPQYTGRKVRAAVPLFLGSWVPI